MQQLRDKTGCAHEIDLRSWKVIQHLNSSGIDEIDMGTIQMHSFLLLEIRTTLLIQQGSPLICDLSFELDDHVAPAFLNFCNLEHHLHHSLCVRPMTEYSATVMPGSLHGRQNSVSA
jgi:hypothetical protein